MTTPNLSLPELVASQSQPHLTLNSALRRLDAVVQLSVASITNTPPGSPVDGDRYIVGTAPSGVWVGREDNVAAYIGTEWVYFQPMLGWVAFVIDVNSLHLYGAGSPIGWDVLETGSGVGSGSLLTDQAVPTNPAAGLVEIFSYQIGNIGIPMFLTPLNEPFGLSLFSGALKLCTIRPDGNYDLFGYSGPTTLGTFATQAGNMTGATLLEFQPSIKLTSNAAANNTAGFRWSATANLGVYRNYTTNPSVGGCLLRMRVSYTTTLATAKHFYGLNSINSLINFGSGADPSASANLIGVGKDEADTNLFFMHNDGSGTATKVDLGISASSLSGGVFDLYIQLARNGNAKIVLHDLESGNAYSTEVTTNLPANDTLLYPKAQAGNGSTATAVIVNSMGVALLDQIGIL
jgi:hypothetical protein